jgi:hypothetical protein
MAFMYCQSCGFKLEYSLEKPNFCINCGTPLGSLSAPESEKESLPASSPVISKLEYTVNSAEANNLTVGDVVKQNPLGSSPRLPQRSKTGDPIKDSIELCRPSKGVDIDGSRGEE